MDQARRLDPDMNLLERSAAGAFDVICDADADIAPLIARRFLPLRERLPRRTFQGFRLACRVIAGIKLDRNPAARHKSLLERHGGGRYEIAPADFGAIEAHFSCRNIEQALHDENALRLPGAADRRDRDLVGENHFDVESIGWNDVSERQRG